MGYFPVVLDLHDRPVLVIGGGSVAQRKVEGLLAAGARITIVSPALTPDLAALAADNRLRHERREYQPGDLAGFSLVFVATSDPALSEQIAREGRPRSTWINAADAPAHCDFILPAVLRRGPLTVSVSSDATSPALAGIVRDELADLLGDEYSALAELVAEVRAELRAVRRSPDGATWRRALDGELRTLVAERRYADARQRLRHRLGVADA
jgi:siroheme synthase-like protein